MSARSTWGQIPSEPRGQIYTDNGVSGAKDSRPALNRLMADAGQRKFDTVLVWKLDRFGRSLRHLINALGEGWGCRDRHLSRGRKS